MTAPVVLPSDTNLAEAAAIIRQGGLVAMPTETVYGLACDATNPRAVARLYAAKGRPSFNPLIAHVANLDAAQKEGVFTPEAEAIAKEGWPGPVTLVLPVAPEHAVCDLARAGLETVALRQPAHPVAASLLHLVGTPLVAPSANPSGRVSPTTAQHVAGDMGDAVDLILDGGPCEIGVESTIISCLQSPPTLLRPGAFDASDFLAEMPDPTRPLAPGALSRHYAPRATLRLNAVEPVSGDAYLGFGPGKATMNLSETGDLSEAAANLFSMLRTLDRTWARIAVAPIPMTGLGLAINDRLARAAKRD